MYVHKAKVLMIKKILPIFWQYFGDFLESRSGNTAKNFSVEVCFWEELNGEERKIGKPFSAESQCERGTAWPLLLAF